MSTFRSMDSVKLALSVGGAISLVTGIVYRLYTFDKPLYFHLSATTHFDHTDDNAAAQEFRDSLSTVRLCQQCGEECKLVAAHCGRWKSLFHYDVVLIATCSACNKAERAFDGGKIQPDLKLVHSLKSENVSYSYWGWKYASPPALQYARDRISKTKAKVVLDGEGKFALLRQLMKRLGVTASGLGKLSCDALKECIRYYDSPAVGEAEFYKEYPKLEEAPKTWIRVRSADKEALWAPIWKYVTIATPAPLPSPHHRFIFVFSGFSATLVAVNTFIPSEHESIGVIESFVDNFVTRFREEYLRQREHMRQS